MWRCLRDCPRTFLLFAYGFFTIAAQALLFREFLTAFEGNDITVGLFFGSWFAWIGAGAILARRGEAFSESLSDNIEYLLLCFPAAFVVELLLVVNARRLAGAEAFELLSVWRMILLAVAVNAPLSILTGIFFPSACRRLQRDQSADRAVSSVFMVEAAGSLAGGIAAAVLLAAGVGAARIFLLLSMLVSAAALAAAMAALAGPRRRTAAVCCAVSLIALTVFAGAAASGADRAFIRRLRLVKWTMLLEKEAYRGSFTTAQAEYLYGVYQGQWAAVREGSVCETVPDETAAGRIAATVLCQRPDARRVLVAGSGLSLCGTFLKLDRFEHVGWVHWDPEFITAVDGYLPEAFRIQDSRFHPAAGDARSLLSAEKGYYDIIVLNLPDVTSSVLNRYFTAEFYRLAKAAMRGGGVLAVRIAGGENIMGTELVNLGASTKLTMQSVFSQLVLTPGEDTWFLVSDAPELTGDPGTLRDRFAAISGSSEVFPPDGLFSIYLPERAAKALESYEAAGLPGHLLFNRDARPLANLYSVLLSAKQSAAPVSRLVKNLAVAGLPVYLAVIAVFVITRSAFIAAGWRRPAGRGAAGRRSGFDSEFMVFSMGLVGIGAVIVLIYLYQTRFGSLYLYIGLISSAYMAGLTAGAALMRRLASGGGAGRSAAWRRHEVLLFCVAIVHVAVLAAIAIFPAALWGHAAFAAAFVASGFCGGCYFPLAAAQLKRAGFDAGAAGSRLETADHLGAAAGGLLTSLALVAVVGTRLTLVVFAALVFANVPLFALRAYLNRTTRGGGYASGAMTAVPVLRSAGYCLFGVAAAAVICSNLLAAAAAAGRRPLDVHTAAALAGDMEIKPASAVLPDSRRMEYFELYEIDSRQAAEGPSEAPAAATPAGYVFSSSDLAPEVRGFGGAMNIAVRIDSAGVLADFQIVRSNETPAYLRLLQGWRQGLLGCGLFAEKPFAGVDTVTGATVTAEAVIESLRLSGRRFAEEVLDRPAGRRENTRTVRTVFGFDKQGIYLLSAFAAASLLAYGMRLPVVVRRGRRVRMAGLAATFVVGGLVLNAQYSSERAAALLSGQLPAVSATGAFVLAVGVVVFVVIFGNLYCGYVCPFGAAQELVFEGGRLFKRLLGMGSAGAVLPAVDAGSMRSARFVKYAVLFVLICAFFACRDRSVLSADGMTGVFKFNLPFSFPGRAAAGLAPGSIDLALLVAVAALAASLYRNRFWCRYLCPSGAFLSLFGRVRLLSRFLPARRYARCGFGLTASDNLDCICCDRCLGPAAAELAPRRQRAMKFPLLPWAVAAAVVISSVSVREFFRATGAASRQTVAAAASGGQPRDVDIELIERLIRQGRLSGREAVYYKPSDRSD